MRILISCGEPSGDLYAGALAREILRQCPEAEIRGFGGDHLEAAGGRLIAHYRGLSATGLTEALGVLPRFWSLLGRLEGEARAFRPDVFVPIDLPDFNFWVMAAMRRQSIPVAYYISPQLWAWRAGRMRAMKRHVARVLVIFPFEEPVYRRAGVPVEFVGHPLVDQMAESPPAGPVAARRAAQGRKPDAPTVALLPGSRHNELQRLAPVLAEAAILIRARVPDAQFVVARAPHLSEGLFAELRALTPPPVLVEGRTDAVLAASDLALTASGTATVQCVLHGLPMVVAYRVSPLTFALGRAFAPRSRLTRVGAGGVDRYAMPNLIAGRDVVPELIQEACTPARVAQEALALLTDPAQAERTRAALADLRDGLGGPGATARAAQAVLAVARGPRRTAVTRSLGSGSSTHSA
jgi:lipid-A-disaccharide synthase